MMVGRGHRGRPGGGGRVGRGGRPTGELPGTEDLTAWLAGRLPDGWFVAAPEVTVDREEILIVGELPAPETESDADAAARAASAAGRISRFREETREDRMEIARQAEHRYGRKVAWGARILGPDDEDGVEELFTTLSVPVMTRLRQSERRVLDTLVDAGVARSRSEALAWAVALVGEHTEPWLAELREAMSTVDELRARGPRLDGDDEPDDDPSGDGPSGHEPA